MQEKLNRKVSLQGFYRPSNSLIRSACTICYILNKSTTYKVSKYIKKTLLYVEELTCYEAMNVERCLYQKIEFGRCRVICHFEKYQHTIYHQMWNHVRNKMAQTIFNTTKDDRVIVIFA